MSHTLLGSSAASGASLETTTSKSPASSWAREKTLPASNTSPRNLSSNVACKCAGIPWADSASSIPSSQSKTWILSHIDNIDLALRLTRAVCPRVLHPRLSSLSTQRLYLSTHLRHAPFALSVSFVSAVTRVEASTLTCRTFSAVSSASTHIPFSKMDPEAQEVAKKVLAMPEIQKLKEVFDKHGKEIRLVGGVVRDILLGTAPKDYDIATTALPDEAQRFLEEEGIRVIATGLQHGTVTAMLNKIPFEITTLRVDESTDGRWAEVRFTADWQADALRRDLTVNAMSIGMDGTLFDYFGGIDHLRARRVLFVGEAAQRIREDYLRILRYFRFHGRLTRAPDHDLPTLAAITECAPGLTRISGERVWQEMGKILKLPTAAALLETMLKTGVLRHIGLDHVTPALIQAMAQAKKDSEDPITLLTALIPSEESFLRLVGAWHLSNTEKFLGLYIVENRARDMTQELAEDEVIAKIPANAVAELLRYQNKPAFAAHISTWPAPVFPITGKELKAHGVAPGPTMGAVLARLKALWVRSRFTLTAATLLAEHLPTVLAEHTAAASQ
eukprot:m.5857 g.5857  ORF g.5857 m.5857 type:complete len:560 (-) comp4642_c0_seq1:53-1732(-)